MLWTKQTLFYLKIEHSFCYYSNSDSYNLFQPSGVQETNSILIRKKTVFYTGLGDN